VEVEERLRLEGGDVTSAQVGLVVLDRLRALDEVAYVRFASVYRSFADLESLKEMLDELLAARLRTAAPIELISGGSGGHATPAPIPPRPRPRWRARKPREVITR
jgi:hypothetical protein